MNPNLTVVNIKVKAQDVNVILGALQELPHKVVNELIHDVLSQANEQVESASLKADKEELAVVDDEKAEK